MVLLWIRYKYLCVEKYVGILKTWLHNNTSFFKIKKKPISFE